MWTLIDRIDQKLNSHIWVSTGTRLGRAWLSRTPSRSEARSRNPADRYWNRAAVGEAGLRLAERWQTHPDGFGSINRSMEKRVGALLSSMAHMMQRLLHYMLIPKGKTASLGFLAVVNGRSAFNRTIMRWLAE